MEIIEDEGLTEDDSRKEEANLDDNTLDQHYVDDSDDEKFFDIFVLEKKKS